MVVYLPTYLGDNWWPTIRRDESNYCLLATRIALRMHEWFINTCILAFSITSIKLQSIDNVSKLFL